MFVKFQIDFNSVTVFIFLFLNIGKEANQTAEESKWKIENNPKRIEMKIKSNCTFSWNMHIIHLVDTLNIK